MLLICSKPVGNLYMPSSFEDLVNNMKMAPVHYDEEPKENLPYVTHEGELEISGIKIKAN